MSSLFLKKFKTKFFSHDAPFWLFYYFLSLTRLDRIVPDKTWIWLRYRCLVGKAPNLKNPKTFTEKLQWLKLHRRESIDTMLVDKVAVKEWVSSKIGPSYIIPTLRVYNCLSDVDWESLPNQFVIKWNHDSHSVVICKDKSSFDIVSAQNKLSKGEHRSGYWGGREWPYKNVTKKILVEAYLEESGKDSLTDYKVMCFSGEPKIIQVHLGRYGNSQTQDFYDLRWNKIEELEQMVNNTSDEIVQCPKCFDEMIKFSRQLSSGFPHVRVDWYVIDNHLYFGEMTFFDASGFEPFLPYEKELEIGSWINL